ncbi:Pr6Pr family membrane protein [Streptomyces tropicalis]|uniref:Pr6Pr family membrane protein n=1 Tax=Streptomyces tropicalis TaxID=3034234 RepID=A0ABT6ACY5_9ACTN|nr:Pr6Pr family membrane protein [Streptomyces tropicalis]MDF3302515.1 Pr6Pr family membrane protein [Streptomyces tropicalis]
MASDHGPNRAWLIAFRSALCAAGAAGLAGTTAKSLASPGPAEFWIYFTVQSNLLLTVFFAALVIRTLWGSDVEDAEGAFPASVKGAMTLYIMITGTVFNLLLANPASPFYQQQKESHYTWDSVLLHVVTPLMALLDWWFFGPRGALRPRHAALWLAYPLAYLAFALGRGAVVTSGTRYPYPFLDVAGFGYGRVCVNCFFLASAFYLLGLGLVALDRRYTPRATPAVTVGQRPG